MRRASSLFCSLLLACAPERPQRAGQTSQAPVTVASGWTAGAALIEAGTVAGRADFRRLLRYTRASGSLELQDSDPFASGTESKTARVLNLSRVLSPEERQRVEAVLDRVQPDAAALERRCAPGGCVWLERVGADGTRQRLEHLESAQPVLRELSALFPEARQF